MKFPKFDRVATLRIVIVTIVTVKMILVAVHGGDFFDLVSIIDLMP